MSALTAADLDEFEALARRFDHHRPGTQVQMVCHSLGLLCAEVRRLQEVNARGALARVLDAGEALDDLDEACARIASLTATLDLARQSLLEAQEAQQRDWERGADLERAHDRERTGRLQAEGRVAELEALCQLRSGAASHRARQAHAALAAREPVEGRDFERMPGLADA